MKNTGFMYWDNRTTKTITEKVIECAGLYEKRYGEKANQVFISPKNWDENILVDGITVLPLRSILPDHLWVGVNII